MIYDVAFGVRTTITRIDAQVVYTGSVTRAIAVRSTFSYNFRWNAVVSWIANVVGRTSTDWIVIVRVT